MLATRALQGLDSEGRGRGAQIQPDRYCYGVTCTIPPTDVEIPEQHLPEQLRILLDETLRDRSDEIPNQGVRGDGPR